MPHVSHLSSAFSLVDNLQGVLSPRGPLHTLAHHRKVPVPYCLAYFVSLGDGGRDMGILLYKLSWVRDREKDRKKEGGGRERKDQALG